MPAGLPCLQATGAMVSIACHAWLQAPKAELHKVTTNSAQITSILRERLDHLEGDVYFTLSASTSDGNEKNFLRK